MRTNQSVGRMLIAAVAFLVGLTACNSDTSLFTISGTVTGLTSGKAVVLSDNGVDSITVSANTTFAFPTPVRKNGTYRVSVVTQPAGQVCTVSNGTGAGVTESITNIRVACSTDTYSVSGTVAGLPSGEKVVLENNAADALTVLSDGKFTFTTPVAFNGSYAVAVGTQPLDATCSVSNGTGAGVTANISNVSVTCALDSYSISGTVSGLANGAQVTLTDNGADPLTIAKNGLFTFPAPIAVGGSYTVTVGTQPTGAICTVSNGQGTKVSGNISNVAVSCATDTFTIGGTLSGLAGGSQVTLDNNGADPLILTSDTAFTFAAPVTYGSAYGVTVGTQPNGQYCGISSASGSNVTSNIATVAVACVANPVTFSTPGTYTWTVPPGVTSVQIAVTGAGGGGGGLYGTNPGQVGGAGAVVTATLTVTPGQVLSLVVGGGGLAGVSGPGSSNQWTCGAGGGGGGASSVDAGAAWQIIAGGGGGGGSCNNATPGGSGSAAATADGGSGASGGIATGGSGGNNGIGGAGGLSNFFPFPSASGGNGNGGPGGSGGSNGGNAYPGGVGGSGVGSGAGGNDTNNDLAGGGGGGYGGGGAGTMGGTGGGAGGSIGPNNATYAPASNGGASATNGADGSITMELPLSDRTGCGLLKAADEVTG